MQIIRCIRTIQLKQSGRSTIKLNIKVGFHFSKRLKDANLVDICRRTWTFSFRNTHLLKVRVNCFIGFGLSYNKTKIAEENRMRRRPLKRLHGRLVRRLILFF